MERIIATIPKNAREHVRVELNEFKGKQLASVRVWADKGDGSPPIATPKGLTVSISLLPSINAALAEAEREAREAGLIPHD
jgi:hypothetical protein